MSVTASTSFAAIDPGIGKVDPRLVGNDRTLDQAIMGYIGVAMTFLAIIGVLYGIWGGFLMLTA